MTREHLETGKSLNPSWGVKCPQCYYRNHVRGAWQRCFDCRVVFRVPPSALTCSQARALPTGPLSEREAVEQAWPRLRVQP